MKDRIALSALLIFFQVCFSPPVFSHPTEGLTSRENKKIYRLLESGRFAEFEKEIAAIPAKRRRIFEGLAALYRADYMAARDIFADVSGEKKDFFASYSNYMAFFWRGFKKKESEHFILRYFSEDELMSDYALSALEKIRLGAFLLLGWSPDSDGEKIIVEIYPDKKSFALGSTLGEEILEKSGTVGICKFNRIMILSPRNLALGYRWVETLAHEYAHFAINRITEYNCPLWVHEGISRWSDTLLPIISSEKVAPISLYRSDFSEGLLSKAALEGKLIPFEKMQNSLVYLPTKEDISLAFAQVADFVDFIVSEHGSSKLSAWLKEMKFSDEKKSFGKVFRFSLSAAKTKWRSRLLAKYKKDVLQQNEKKSGGIPDLPLYNVKSEEDLLPSDMMRHARLGDELRRRGNFEAAFDEYNKAWIIDKNPVIAVKMARSLISMGKLKEARLLMESVVVGNRNYITPYLILAEIANLEGDSIGARRFFVEVFEINPFYPGLADALLRR